MKTLKITVVSVFIALAVLDGSFAVAASKKVIVVSDIDDTLKVAHILNPVRAAARVANYSAHFTGMAQLFQLLARQPGTQTDFVYLSNAPSNIAGIKTWLPAHQKFLQHNNFPAGKLNLRDDFFEKNHKIIEIRKLVNLYAPDVIIFLGDNGERDTEIYQQAVQEFQSTPIQFYTFIHQVYKTEKGLFDRPFHPEIGKKLKPSQTGFVTPVEIALELHQQGLLDAPAMAWIVDDLAPFIAAEAFYDVDTVGAISFPSFLKCRDFVWRWPVTNALVPLVRKIKSVCR